MAKAMVFLADQQPEGDKVRLQVAVVIVTPGNTNPALNIRFDSNVIVDLGTGTSPNSTQLNNTILTQVNTDAAARGFSIPLADVITANKFT
jgi:hypothetical protein